jgi:hypothetical protein
MSDAHFSFTTGELTAVLLICLAIAGVAVFIPTALIHWIGHVRWLYAAPLGALVVVALLFGIRLYVSH